MDTRVSRPALQATYDDTRSAAAVDGWIEFRAIGIRRGIMHSVNVIAAKASSAFPHLEIFPLSEATSEDVSRREQDVAFADGPYDSGRLVEYEWDSGRACLGLLFAWKANEPEKQIHVELLCKAGRPLKRRFFQGLAKQYKTFAADMQ